MVELERRPSELDLLASIFRTLYTIKGTCGFPGLVRQGGPGSPSRRLPRRIARGRLRARLARARAREPLEAPPKVEPAEPPGRLRRQFLKFRNPASPFRVTLVEVIEAPRHSR